MNQDTKDRWVAALRSGEYTQGRGQLRRYNYETGVFEWCCIGVYCDVTGIPFAPWALILYPTHPEYATMVDLRLSERNDGDSWFDADGYDAYDDEPPQTWDFSQLADFIEANYPVED